MSAITTRQGKGSPLTNAEVDANFTNLNDEKSEKANNLSDLANVATARNNLSVFSQAESQEQAIAMALVFGS